MWMVTVGIVLTIQWLSFTAFTAGFDNCPSTDLNPPEPQETRLSLKKNKQK